MHAIDFPPRKTSRPPVSGYNSNYLHFRFNKSIDFPESGSGKHFDASKMRSISFSFQNNQPYPESGLEAHFHAYYIKKYLEACN
jgi:hypothetical protein